MYTLPVVAVAFPRGCQFSPAPEIETVAVGASIDSATYITSFA